MLRMSMVMMGVGLIVGYGSPSPRERFREDVGIIRGTVRERNGGMLPGVTVRIESPRRAATTDSLGRFRFDAVPVGRRRLIVEGPGYAKLATTVRVRRGDSVSVDLVVSALAPARQEGKPPEAAAEARDLKEKLSSMPHVARDRRHPRGFDYNTEEYRYIQENGWLEPRRRPLSTFAVDVDAASYANVRRFIRDGQLPPKDAVRIEEMVNYFRYDHRRPRFGEAIAISTEIARAPWNPRHRLAMIGLQTEPVVNEELPPSNLVFLIDVSGSMNHPDKLPLVKSAFRLLVDQLSPRDRVAIVVYAGAAGQVLPSTSGRDRERILEAIDRLEAGGSTAGGAGIRLAYRVARENFLRRGNNRVILATDGDFNVGVSSEGELVRLIEEEKRSGVFLTVLGFGTGNLKDSKMEQLANKGNGHYAYVDDLMEARKVFVQEMGATLLTVAKDVKVQVEFNPARVRSYRLIGYENRILADRDFNDDRKDGGEMGAGHSVTALYEIIPVGVGRHDEDDYDDDDGIDPLKYQDERRPANESDDWFTVKVRYQPPSGSVSRLIQRAVRRESSRPSTDFRFAAAVASFGMVLRDSEFRGAATFESVLELARRSKGEDLDGYRAEFIQLVERARRLSDREVTYEDR